MMAWSVLQEEDCSIGMGIELAPRHLKRQRMISIWTLFKKKTKAIESAINYGRILPECSAHWSASTITICRGILIGWCTGIDKSNITLGIIPFRELDRQDRALDAAMTQRTMKRKRLCANNIDLEVRLTTTDIEDGKLVNAPLEASMHEHIHLPR